MTTYELYGPGGSLAMDTSEHPEDYEEAIAAIPRELAAAVASGEAHPLDAAHGLHLQQLLAEAVRSAG